MRLTKKIWLVLGLLVGLMLAVDVARTRHEVAEEARRESEYEARNIHALVMATRRVYQDQFVKSGLPVTDATLGFLPAHSIARIAREFPNWSNSGIRFNNVSDRPRNPGNMADRFEMEAIDWFRANPAATERMRDIVEDNGVGYLHYTAPIRVEAPCLKCHGARAEAPAGLAEKYDTAFDYRVGDLRGIVSLRMPKAQIEERVDAIWRQRLIESLAGYAVLLLGLGLLLHWLIIRRLARLQSSADQLAAGNYEARASSSGSDEICQLAASFDRMAEAVQARDQQLVRLSHYDPLTGLPNRMLLEDRLDLALALSLRQSTHGALLLVNIDRFKMLNDARGHSLGDALLIALGGRLFGLLRDGDTLARLGADEFAILLQGLHGHRETASNGALAVAQKVHADLRLPFMLSGKEEITLTASIGVTLCPDGGNDSAREVLRRANTALHRAKEAGGHQTAFFETGMGEAAEQRFHVERELRKAIAAGELRLYLQPQVDDHGRRVGAEALVRWQHPQRGLLPPGAFIGIAEESSLIVEVGGWVLAQACQLMARETVAGRPLRMSVNISPRQFRQADFVPWVKEVLAASGADPTHLTLEVTEGVVIDNVSDVVAKMSELTALGIHFSIDDFGTGYSSLAYLKRLPIDELKIDKTFIQDAPNDPGDAAVVETILSVARHMHLKVVAEGVETEEQARYLRQLANITYQGYLFGKPDAAETWLERWRAVAP
ncbi:MAG: EAL domain-containing protein [Rhodocyclaceae bacterium]|nr:EAL domain-containing protein [Rhodocyclaceae bacterium]MBK9312388.1 EAL domain-containing protein [Rhodocyclaceae bacterium]MBK9953927.1 EAL domain-containing protein [Rhodocyclaceae bacterium]